MLTKELEDQFRFVSLLTNYTTGSPFKWNRETKKLEVSTRKTFHYVRHILVGWSVLSFLYQTYWLYVGLCYKDQQFVEIVLDLLYFSGGILCVFLHVAFYFVENVLVDFCNVFLNLSKEFESTFSDAIKKRKTKRNRVTSSTIMKALQLISHNDSVAAAAYYLRIANHRRYDVFIYPLFNWGANGWGKYPLGFIFTFLSMVHRWSALLFYLFTQAAYCEMVTFWLRILRRKIESNDYESDKLFTQIRTIQIFHNRHNGLFRYINCYCIFAIWFNIVIYSVISVVETIPFPEYVILPTIAISFAVYLFIVLKQMSNVRIEYEKISREPKFSKLVKAFLKTVKPLGLEIGEYFVVDHLAPLIFLGITLNYFIDGILAIR